MRSFQTAGDEFWWKLAEKARLPRNTLCVGRDTTCAWLWWCWRRELTHERPSEGLLPRTGICDRHSHS